AHNMLVRRTGPARIWRYWDYPDEPLALGPEAAAESVRELLADSVRLRLRSDVPVGTSLSAGLDSATIACLVRTVHGGEHLTFTASFPGERFDEAPRAAALATSLGMDPFSVPVEPKAILPLLGKVVHHLDAPTQCPAVVPLWNIMQAMSGKVVVALDGQGSDELFGGYIDRVFGYSILDSLRERRLRQAAGDLRQHVQTWGWWTTLSWSARDLVPASHRWYRRVRQDEAVYVGPLRGGPDDLPVRADARLPDNAVNRVLRSQHEGGLRTLLQYGDAMSMAHSIEVRMPYLDYRLVELGFRLQGSLKVNGAQGKVVLRNAVDDIVPEDIVGIRRKLGFATPLARWFREFRDELVEPVLFDETCRQRGLLDPARLRQSVDRHMSGQVDLSSQIFRWITAELWFRQFIDA
ncbi:MAG TPA: asparagine synthase C-terminal domain-containing protein, partial [Mycobacterium sp.]|nr:asparagine synthase C-terminal domain-containing protein [Mycobacterium sp.]